MATAARTPPARRFETTNLVEALDTLLAQEDAFATSVAGVSRAWWAAGSPRPARLRDTRAGWP